ncbi:MAG TPA: DUF6634 family protein [Thermomicrobiales bacterium]|nr:DUF6634 family protein [Thermomicrobiales bacterium]
MNRRIRRKQPPVHQQARPPPPATGARSSGRPYVQKTKQTMTMNSDFLNPNLLDCEMPNRLHRLADDIRKILDGTGPSTETLAGAPLLENWRYVASKLGARLAGNVVGHPRLRGGAIVTSPAWVTDPQERWCRTTSRYYRLGKRVDRDDELSNDLFTDDFNGDLR